MMMALQASTLTHQSLTTADKQGCQQLNVGLELTPNLLILGCLTNDKLVNDLDGPSGPRKKTTSRTSAAARGRGSRGGKRTSSGSTGSRRRTPGIESVGQSGPKRNVYRERAIAKKKEKSNSQSASATNTNRRRNGSATAAGVSRTRIDLMPT